MLHCREYVELLVRNTRRKRAGPYLVARNQKDDEYSLAEDSSIRCLMNIHEEEKVNRANVSSV